MRKFKPALAVFLLVSVFASAQAPDTVDTIFAPFVSRLRTGVKESSVVLMWDDSEDVPGNCLIYRYTSEITSDTFLKSTLIGEVPNGKKTFTDTPPVGMPVFYCVLVKDDFGNPYTIFVPFKNKSIAAISTNPGGGVAETIAVAKITSIKTITKDQTIQISFSSSLKGRKFIIYRSTSPIRELRDLLDAQTIGSLTESELPYSDFPVPGIDYYYAVIDENSLKAETLSISAGENTLKAPVSVPSGIIMSLLPDSRSGFLRPIPLPSLSVSVDISDGTLLRAETLELPRRIDTSLETEKVVARLSSSGIAEHRNAPERVILAVDKNGSSYGENYTLASIVNGAFAAGNLANAVTLLEKFLSIHRTDDTKARARFYLGQCLILTGKYREGFFHILLAQDVANSNISVWKDYALFMLRNGS